MQRTITDKEITKRANLLFTALELLWAEPNREMVREDFMDLLKTAPSATNISSSLSHHNIIKLVARGRNKGIIQYVGIAPNPVVCKKVVEYAVERARSWNTKHKATQRNNKTMTVQEAAATIVKPGPLQYTQFLKELSILKERYKMTVSNAEIEITVKVSSLANV